MSCSVAGAECAALWTGWISGLMHVCMERGKARRYGLPTRRNS